MHKLLYLLAAVALATLGAWAIVRLSAPKTAFVSNTVLYEKFQGRLEREQRLKNIENRQKAALDSLALGLQLSAPAAGEQAQARLVSFNRTKEQTELALAQQARAYDEECWTQISQYVEEYGREHDYDYIFGASGNGSLMYAGTGENITEQVIEYINRRYHGH
jgi:outer membrane protein